MSHSLALRVLSHDQLKTPSPARVQLREKLGPKAMVSREAPAKWSLLGVNRKPELIEKRRRELEAWLWKLIADPRAARSRSLNNFLELSDVARVVTRCAPRDVRHRSTYRLGISFYFVFRISDSRSAHFCSPQRHFA